MPSRSTAPCSTPCRQRPRRAMPTSTTTVRLTIPAATQPYINSTARVRAAPEPVPPHQRDRPSITRCPTMMPVSTARDQPTVPDGKSACPPVNARRNPAPSTNPAAATTAVGNAGQDGCRSLSASGPPGPPAEPACRRPDSPERDSLEPACPAPGNPEPPCPAPEVTARTGSPPDDPPTPARPAPRASAAPAAVRPCAPGCPAGRPSPRPRRHATAIRRRRSREPGAALSVGSIPVPLTAGGAHATRPDARQPSAAPRWKAPPRTLHGYGVAPTATGHGRRTSQQ